MTKHHQTRTTTTAPGTAATALEEKPVQLSEGNSAQDEVMDKTPEPAHDSPTQDVETEITLSNEVIVGRLLLAVATGARSLAQADSIMVDRHKQSSTEDRQALREILLKYRTIAERLLSQYDSIPV